MRLRPQSLTGRLFAGILAVVAIAAATAWIVGTLVAPRTFHDHLHHALPEVSSAVLAEADEAFAAANTIALGVAALAALLTAVAASVWLRQRLSRTMAPVTHAARRVAAGQYDARIDGQELGVEFAELVAAFNDMAARLQHTDELRSGLLSDVAHELRTPVATLRAHVEGLQDGVTQLDDETATVLLAQTARLTRLTDDMAAVSGAEERGVALRLRETDLAALVHLVVAGAKEAFAARGVALRIQPGAPLVIPVDDDRMAQVLTNLFDNALRHTPEGGTVEVAVRRRSGVAEIAVRDTGTGISEEHLSRVFDRFYRVEAARDRSSGGSGIGLAIARSIVEAHGGRITAHSSGLGRGSTFTVLLPDT